LSNTLFYSIVALYAKPGSLTNYSFDPIKFKLSEFTSIKFTDSIQIFNDDKQELTFNIISESGAFLEEMSETHFSKPVIFDPMIEILSDRENSHVPSEVLVHKKDAVMKILETLTEEESEVCVLKIEEYISNEA
jgi:hypothetical protein